MVGPAQSPGRPAIRGEILHSLADYAATAGGGTPDRGEALLQAPPPAPAPPLLQQIWRCPKIHERISPQLPADSATAGLKAASFGALRAVAAWPAHPRQFGGGPPQPESLRALRPPPADLPDASNTKQCRARFLRKRRFLRGAADDAEPDNGRAAGHTAMLVDWPHSGWRGGAAARVKSRNEV